MYLHCKRKMWAGGGWEYRVRGGIERGEWVGMAVFFFAAGRVRRAGVLISATLGSLAGGILVIPLMVVASDWLFLSLPQVVGSVFASSVAYLAAGPARKALECVMAISLLAAVACVLVNLALLSASANGIVASGDVLLPGGWATHVLEAVAVGVIAGLVATKAERARPAGRAAFWVAVFLSATATTVLLIVGSQVLPVFFAA